MYVIDKDAIYSNISSIRKAFLKHDIRLMLCYSYKTNMMPEVIDIMDEYDVFPEVVSQYEYDNARLHSNRIMICNGVAMSYEDMASSILNYDIVNFNDIESAKRVRKILNNDVRYNVGLRIRFEDNSRFGVSVNDLSDALNELESLNFDLICIHCHVTNTRGLNRYKQKVKRMIDAIIDNGINPPVIDFGGSMYGLMNERLASTFDDVCDFNDYASVINNEIKRLSYKPIIALELGTALIANAVDVVGEVIRVDEYNRIVLNVDKYTVGMVINRKLEYTFIPSDSSKKMVEGPFCKVYGCTCMEDDLLIDDFEYIPDIGDEIVFHNCGAYSYCFEPNFIVPKQKIVIKI